MPMKQNNPYFGILLPIFSLPSPHGIGTLGKSAFHFVDFLKESGAKVWQMLPLNVTSYGDSPYQSPSSKGLNYYFIDLDTLVEEGLLLKEEIDDSLLYNDERRVNYQMLFHERLPILKKAFSRFNKDDPLFVEFLEQKEYHDFAFYMLLKEIHNYQPFSSWEDADRNYSPEREKESISKHYDLYLFYIWTQFEFLKQYKALKKYANENGIKIMGDMPIYVAYDSVESYKYPELFLFDEEHKPTFIAGVPPDAFSELGQLWGNPIYNWEYQKKTGYQWFNKRISDNLQIFDMLRIDHFRGFSAFYKIPFGREDARIGEWCDGPKFDLFKDKKELPIIAENLGVIDQGVIDLLTETGYPGMEVVLFAINNDYYPDSNKPWNAPKHSVTYVGTHDNETLMGFLKEADEEHLTLYKKVIHDCATYLHVDYEDETLDKLTNTVNQIALAYPSEGCFISMQDLLHLDNEARINHPSTLSDRNWSYRFVKDDFTFENARKISDMIHSSGR